MEMARRGCAKDVAIWATERRDEKIWIDMDSCEEETEA